jgi:pyridoxamine 5'-phosphate oxidase
MSAIADIRKEYKQQSLSEHELAGDPFAQFHTWWKQAIESEIDEVNAMTLATANKNGHPSARIVLLKDADETGFVFYTNYNSSKGIQLEENPFAALVFFWKELERQIRIEGTIAKVDEPESDAYFASRPRESKIGAWASAQSNIVVSRTELEAKVAEIEKKYPGEIPRPPHWGGYRLIPDSVEFWQGRPGRLHDRLRYSKGEENNWTIERLAP